MNFLKNIADKAKSVADSPSRTFSRGEEGSNGAAGSQEGFICPLCILFWCQALTNTIFRRSFFVEKGQMSATTPVSAAHRWLVEMGFSITQVEQALAKHVDVDAALDALLQAVDGNDPEPHHSEPEPALAAGADW